MGGLLRNPVTGKLYRNAGGGLIFNGLEAAQECCCAGDPPNNPALLAAIRERQKIALIQDESLIDLDGQYTLAQLCYEANRFSGESLARWVSHSGWTDKANFPPMFATNAHYFGLMGSGKTVEVADEEELLSEVVQFKESSIGALTHTSLLRSHGGFTGSAAILDEEGEVIQEMTPWADVIAAAESSWQHDVYGQSNGLGVFKSISFTMYGDPSASSRAVTNDAVGVSLATTDSRSAGTYQKWIRSEPSGSRAGSSFNAFGCGVINGQFAKISQVYSEGHPAQLQGPRWSGYPGVPSGGWPTGGEFAGLQDYKSEGWRLTGLVIFLEWDFEYL